MCDSHYPIAESVCSVGRTTGANTGEKRWIRAVCACVYPVYHTYKRAPASQPASNNTKCQ